MIRKIFTNWLYKHRPPEVVKYWRRSEAAIAKVTESPEGHLVMHLQGEKYPFPGFPRGHLLFGSLSPLKHNVKVKLFNESWEMLEEGKSTEEIVKHIKDSLDEILELAEETCYDMLPPEKMCPAVKEIWRAWSEVEKSVEPVYRDKLRGIKEILTFILQEDDGYRFRVQWLAGFFNPNSWWNRLRKSDPVKDFERVLKMLEHAEVVNDMKGRIKLLRTILLVGLKDEGIRTLFERFVKEVDWKKLQLSKADKYYFRAKYFKVDYPYYEY